MPDGISAQPMPWDEYAPGMFRLPGFGGAAMFLRSVILPNADGDAQLGFDVGLLSPQAFTRHLCRTANPGSGFRRDAQPDGRPPVAARLRVRDLLHLPTTRMDEFRGAAGRIVLHDPHPGKFRSPSPTARSSAMAGVDQPSLR